MVIVESPESADQTSAGHGVADEQQEAHFAAVARTMLVEAAKALRAESGAARPDPARMEHLVARLEMLTHALAAFEQRNAEKAVETRVAGLGEMLERNDEKILSVVQRMSATLAAMNARLQRLEEAAQRGTAARAEKPAASSAQAAPAAPPPVPAAEPEPAPAEDPEEDDPLKDRISSALVAIAAALKSGPQATGGTEEPVGGKSADR